MTNLKGGEEGGVSEERRGGNCRLRAVRPMSQVAPFPEIAWESGVVGVGVVGNQLRRIITSSRGTYLRRFCSLFPERRVSSIIILFMLLYDLLSATVWSNCKLV